MRKLYAVAVDSHEAMLRSRDIADICWGTHVIRTQMGSADDTSLYFLYGSETERDGAYQAFREMFISARTIYSPFIEEDEK